MLATAGLIGHLRDSTRTALAGDLGQAFTWLLAVEHFKNTAVVDFGRGCSKRRAAKAAGRSCVSLRGVALP